MNKDNKREFVATIKALAVNAGVEITADVSKLYFEVLKEFSIEEIQLAVISLLKTWEYNRIPPLSILRREITGKGQSIDDKAVLIASSIISHLRRRGSKTALNLEGDNIAIELMRDRWPYHSWAETVLEKDLDYWAKDFCRLYHAMSRRNETFLISQTKIMIKSTLMENEDNHE